MLIGSPVKNKHLKGKDLFNAAYFLHEKEVKAIIHKTLLPTYDVFDETRYFKPGEKDFFIQYKDKNIAVTICEDIWQADGPVHQQAKAGATLNININGSPYHRGKFDERQQMVSERARANSCAIVYVNQVCGQDELVFDGGSMVFDHRGDMLMRAEQFGESLTRVLRSIWRVNRIIII